MEMIKEAITARDINRIISASNSSEEVQVELKGSQSELYIDGTFKNVYRLVIRDNIDITEVFTEVSKAQGMNNNEIVIDNQYKKGISISTKGWIYGDINSIYTMGKDINVLDVSSITNRNNKRVSAYMRVHNKINKLIISHDSNKEGQNIVVIVNNGTSKGEIEELEVNNIKIFDDIWMIRNCHTVKLNRCEVDSEEVLFSWLRASRVKYIEVRELKNRGRYEIKGSFGNGYVEKGAIICADEVSMRELLKASNEFKYTDMDINDIHEAIKRCRKLGVELPESLSNIIVKMK